MIRKLLAFYMILMVSILASCSTQEDGTALIASSRLQAEEFEGIANAFASITSQSAMPEAAKTKVLERIAQARSNYNRLREASEMLIQNLTEVDYARLIPEIEAILNRYIPKVEGSNGN